MTNNRGGENDERDFEFRLAVSGDGDLFFSLSRLKEEFFSPNPSQIPITFFLSKIRRIFFRNFMCLEYFFQVGESFLAISS